MRELGVDVGDRRLGIAISDALSPTAQDLLLLARDDHSVALASLLEISTTYQVDHKAVRDKIAAQLILQNNLDYQHPSSGPPILA